jgi:transcriptional regulator with XRE-family HTH domain
MLGKRLSEQRKKHKLKQEELANKIGVARTTYAMYEQGNRHPDYETLQTIAGFFGVSRAYLLGDTDDPNSYKDEENARRADLKELFKKYDGLTWGDRKLTPEETKWVKKIVEGAILEEGDTN